MVNQQSVPITQESGSPFCCPDPITVVPVFKIRGSDLESFNDIRTWNNSFSVKKATTSPPANLSLGGINFFIKEVSRVQGVQHPCSYENQSGANFKMKSVMIVFPVYISYDQYRLCLYGSWVLFILWHRCCGYFQTSRSNGVTGVMKPREKCVGPYLHSSYGMYAGAGASSLHFNHAVVWREGINFNHSGPHIALSCI